MPFGAVVAEHADRRQDASLESPRAAAARHASCASAARMSGRVRIATSIDRLLVGRVGGGSEASESVSSIGVSSGRLSARRRSRRERSRSLRATINCARALRELRLVRASRRAPTPTPAVELIVRDAEQIARERRIGDARLKRGVAAQRANVDRRRVRRRLLGGRRDVGARRGHAGARGANALRWRRIVQRLRRLAAEVAELDRTDDLAVRIEQRRLAWLRRKVEAEARAVDRVARPVRRRPSTCGSSAERDCVTRACASCTRYCALCTPAVCAAARRAASPSERRCGAGRLSPARERDDETRAAPRAATSPAPMRMIRG